MYTSSSERVDNGSAPMDDTVQLKKHIDDTVAALTRRLTDAHQRKVKADQEAASSANEITVITKALQDFKPLQGFFGSVTAIAAAAAATSIERGSNRQIVTDILTNHGAPMTNGEIAKVAHEKGSIKSKKGLPGVYATVATVLRRGRDNLFVNHGGQWDLRVHTRKISLSAEFGVKQTTLDAETTVKIPVNETLKVPATGTA